MPAPVAGIHVLKPFKKDVDGRDKPDKPGHDERKVEIRCHWYDTIGHGAYLISAPTRSTTGCGVA